MPTLSSTLTALRQGLAGILGEYISGTTTGAGDTTSLIDATNLVHYADNYFNGRWVLLTSGTYSGSIVKVTNFVQSTGDCTFTPALAGNVGNAVTYELHRYHPTNQLRWALNKALQMSHPNLRKEVTCDDLVAGNWLYSGAMEDWTNGASSAPDGWALTGDGATITRTARGTTNTAWAWGAYLAQLTRVGTDCYLASHAGLWPPMLDLMGKSVRLEAWVKSATASRGRISILADESGVLTSQDSTLHSTAGLAELVRTDEVTMPALSQGDAIEVRLESITANVANGVYFDNVRLIGPDCYVYALPLAFQNKGPDEVWIQTGSWSEGNERPCDDRGDVYPYVQLNPSYWKAEYDNTLGLWLLKFSRAPAIGYRIRLRGSELLSTVTAETDTTQLKNLQLDVLYPLAAREMFSALGVGVGLNTDLGKDYMSLAGKFHSDWEREKRRAGQKTFPVQVNYGNWRY